MNVIVLDDIDEEAPTNERKKIEITFWVLSLHWSLIKLFMIIDVSEFHT